MVFRKGLLIFCFLIAYDYVFSQEKQTVQATRTTTAPKIDGILNETCWQQGVVYSHFIESFPEFGPVAKFRTEVIFIYDNDAIYIGARCFMPPDSIWMQYTERDNIFDNTDAFSVTFDTYRDGQNALGFGVSPRNVQ